MTIVDAGGNRYRAFGVSRDLEFVADQGGAAGLNGVVIGHGMDGPDFVVVDKLAGEVDGAVGETVGARIEHAVGL